MPVVVRRIRVRCGPDVAPATRSGRLPVGPIGRDAGGYQFHMADPDPNDADLLQRAKQAQARSKALQGQLARMAEAVAEVEEEVARVHRQLAAQGGPLAEEAREHAERAEEWAAKERAEAERLRRTEPD